MSEILRLGSYLSTSGVSLTRDPGFAPVNKETDVERRIASSDRDIARPCYRVLRPRKLRLAGSRAGRKRRLACSRERASFWAARCSWQYPTDRSARSITRITYVLRRVHFRWLRELERSGGYASSFVDPRGFAANFAFGARSDSTMVSTKND